MFWQKKKGMIDVGRMAQRGMIKVPRQEKTLPTDREGFVEVNSTLSNISSPTPEKKDPGFFDFLGFGGASSDSSSQKSEAFSTETNGYSKREVDVKLEELDNKIYKMEQRIEVLERKIGVNNY